MAEDIRISELSNVSSLGNNDLIEVSQVNAQSETGYDSKKATLINVGDRVCNGIEYANALYTSNKKIIGAINELTTYIPVYNNTASGAIATFDTSLALPLQDLQIEINAVQESGTPTPSSPKAISGFTGANIKVAGNLLNENNKYQFSYNTVMLGESAGNTYSTHLKATTYTISFKRPTSVPFKVYYNKLGGSGIDIMTYGQKTSASFTVAEEGDYRFVAYYNSGAVAPTDITEIMLVAGSDVKPYQAYTAPTTTAITWQSEAGTVYGGSLDVTSGRLTVTYSSVDLGSLTWSDANGNLSSSLGIATDVKAPSANTQAFNGLCSCYEVAPRTGISDKQISVQTNGNIVISDTGIASMTGAQIKSYVTGFILVYELATPVTYQLTPTQISAIVGTNNVFTDTNGNTSVVYACSLKDYIDSQ